MYMPVLVEECSMGVLILGSLYTLCWVFLIAGVEYRVQRWGGGWDGMMGVANSCNWHFVQGWRSPRIWRWPERLDEGSIASYEQVYSVGFL